MAKSCTVHLHVEQRVSLFVPDVTRAPQERHMTFAALSRDRLR